MNPPRRWLLMAASVAALFAAYPATARPYPSRPATMVVPASGLDAWQKAEIERWWPTVKAARIEAE